MIKSEGYKHQESPRKRLESLRAQLSNERATFLTHWRDLGDYILPRRPRFFVSDANKGDRRNHKIINSTATLAARTLRSGMMGGVTSPARPWFRLTLPDPDLAAYGSVKAWLHLVSERISTTFLRSDVYNTLPIVYGDLGTFATAPMFMEEDFKTVISTESFPVGSYMIAKDHTGRVNVFFREFRMTVRQLVERFGEMTESGRADWSKFSSQVRSHWDRGNYEAWIDVNHVIQPNIDHDTNKSHSKYKKFSSCYYEAGSNMRDSDANAWLRESGYDYFPVLCPRWEVTGEDVYGTDCPGMTALGDIKALQTLEKRKAQAIEKMVNPPMVGPSTLRNQRASLLPGDITYVDSREGMQGFRPAHEVNIRLADLDMSIREHEQRIRRAYFEDLFLMLAESDRRQITATEIDARKEEKLLALGPVLEQLNQDLLDPLISNTFEIMSRQGMIPPPPEEVQGAELKVEYISIMAQAQKLIGISSIERFTGFVGQVLQANPASASKINSNKLIDVYADMTSIPPNIVRPDEEADAIVAQQQQAQAQAQQMQMMEQGASAAKSLSQASLEDDSALKSLLDQAQAGQLTEGV